MPCSNLGEKRSREKNDDNYMLTLGQASCLVLGLPPTHDNRKKAKKIIEESSLFEVTYKRSTDPLYPFVIGKQVKDLNPYLYKSYPPTPPAEDAPSPGSFL